MPQSVDGCKVGSPIHMKSPKTADFQICLKQYATAALGVAGASAMAAAQVPAGHIQYTPADTFITDGHSSVIPIDFNHDGITDISLSAFFYTFAFSGHGGFNYTGVFAKPAAGNLAIGGHAIPKGVPLSLAGVFKGSIQRMAYAAEQFTSYGNVSHFGGPFHNVTNEYLGVQFQVDGQPHYGWVRVSLFCRQGFCGGDVSGYAYETLPGVSIAAGQLRASGADAQQSGESLPSGSLGALAAGAAAIPYRRK